MSIEITLYTKKGTKSGLIKFLQANKFNRARHFIKELNMPDWLHFMWFEHEDYISTTGVEAAILRPSEEERNKYKCADWILHTRTRSSGSHEDKAYQNKIIKLARQQFGGTFYNDWYGSNKYINLTDYDKFRPIEKALSLIANNSLEKLELIQESLAEYTNQRSQDIHNINLEAIKRLFKFKDPSTILYNSLMPFLVSVLEYFFGQCFETFLRYDNDAKKFIIEEKLKLNVEDVINIIDKRDSLEQIITKSYNFQNLDQINRAYKKYLNIDLFATLAHKRRIGSNITRVSVKLQEIMEARHRFVHELDINYDLTKEQYLNYLLTIKITITMVIEVMKAKELRIEIDF